jgi:murein DD-endopeptidase MepM/ murein hydrolase activator NlpD
MTALALVIVLALPSCAEKRERLQEEAVPPSRIQASATGGQITTPPTPKSRQGGDVTAPRKQKDQTPAALRTADSSVRRMLKSAGRDPDAAQPEPGFTLTAPANVGDGEAFEVAFEAGGAREMTLSWRGKKISLSREGDFSGTFRALLPVPLDEQSPSLPMVMTVLWDDGRSERFSADIPVRKRSYPVQRLKVDQKFVTPPPETLEKIRRDREEMRAAIAGVTPRRYWNLPLRRPVPGEVTSLYGLRRVFNGQPKSPHKGVDFDARQGDPVAAVEDGVTVLVAEHYYGGNTVVIDHGLGVFSVYLHLSGFAVSPGQKVARGETIGFIGSTGRVTGPHLHLSFYVLGESVNAATCIAM